MTRIKTLSTIAMTFFASLSFMACQKQTPSESKEATNLSTNAQPIKLAYVEVDSIMTRYQFATEYAAVLKKKMETIQSTTKDLLSKKTWLTSKTKSNKVVSPKNRPRQCSRLCKRNRPNFRICKKALPHSIRKCRIHTIKPCMIPYSISLPVSTKATSMT